MATYNPAKVSVVVVGPVVIPKVVGYTAGSFVSATRSRERFKIMVGVDGEIARRRSRDRTGVIALNLEAASVTNPVLQLLEKVDDVSQSGVSTVFIRDANGVVDLAIGHKAFLVGPPNYLKAARSGNVQWRFEVGRLEIIHGGLREG